MKVGTAYLTALGFLYIVDGLAMVLTLGRWQPGFNLSFSFWSMERQMKRKRALNKERHA